MKNANGLLSGNRTYFIGFLIFLFAGSLLMLINGKGALSVSPTSQHPFWLNVFFINFTFIGDGVFAIALAAVFLFYLKKRKQGLALLNAVLLTGISIQLVKNFSSFPNPAIFFEQGQYLFSTDGIASVNDPAAVSGHTALAFAMATVLIGMMKNKKWQIPVLFAAAVVSYSRMYLAQHTLISVMTGAIIGTGFGIISLMVSSGKLKFPRFGKKKVRYAQRGNVVYR